MVTDLVAALAGVLRLKPEKINPEQTFRSLGVDSLLTVEFIATVNARYGTAMKAFALLDHPTPLDFARHVASELGVRAFPAAVPAALPPTPSPAPVPVAGAAPLPGGPVPATASPDPGTRKILDLLREELARLLCCDPWDIEPTAAFGLLGVDSIIGAQFVAVINRTYGMSERAVTLYDHPDLTALAVHIASASRAPAAPQAPVAAVSGTAAPQPGPPGVQALLDAVRDDRLTIDEALTLLPGRA
ncbi:acyl carrier protein [Streptomyces sp. NPDC001743]|uniref:acyl carrier protein n=1 Tax=Streptomyces sp. NPDC001743 TaxID=3154397 RepID=UPI00331BFCCB